MGVSAFFAAKIGGTSIGLYGNLYDTELDSHANMAVAGKGCTIIAMTKGARRVSWVLYSTLELL